MLPGKAYKPEDVVQIIRRGLWLLLVPFAVVSAAVAVWVHELPDQYRAETVILVVPQRVPESYVRATVTSGIEDRLRSLQQQIMSRTRLEKIIQDFNLYAKDRKTGIMEDVVEQMRKDIGLQVVRGDAFRITYVGDNPRTVMRVTERLATLFIDENLRDREVLAEGTNEFLETQLEDARRRLVENEKKLEDYRRQYAGQLPSQVDSNLQVLQSGQMQAQALAESINRDRDRQLLLEQQIGDMEQQQDAVATGPVDATSLEQQLGSARANLAALQTRFKPEHPAVQQAARVVRDLEKKVAEGGNATPVTAALPTSAAARARRLEAAHAELEQLKRTIAKKQADEQKIRSNISTYQARIEAVPTRESEMTEMMRDYTTLQSLYASLLAKKEDSKLSANLERRQIGEQFKLLDAARLPEKPFSPNRIRLTSMGMAAGLALGLLVIAFFEYRDSTFETDLEVMRVMALPVLAVVPMMQSAAEKKWAFKKRVLIGTACTATVVVCLAVVAYTFVR